MLRQSVDTADFQPLLMSSEAGISESLNDTMFSNSNNKLLLLLQSVRTHSSRAALIFQLRSVVIYTVSE